MEQGLQFCFLFLPDVLGASLELILLKPAQGKCRDVPCLQPQPGSISGPVAMAPALHLPLTGYPLVTHSQALLPALCLMQVDNSCFFCSALKIRWLLALFSHAEELTLSHILLCPPLSYTNGLRPSTLPSAHGPRAQHWVMGSSSLRGDLWPGELHWSSGCLGSSSTSIWLGLLLFPSNLGSASALAAKQRSLL